MKIYLITAMLFTIAHSSFGQNTFPTSGNVGIGTLNPGSILSVQVGVKKKVEVDSISASSLIDFSYGGAALKFSRPNDGIGGLHGIFSYINVVGESNLGIGSRGDIVFSTGGINTYEYALEAMRILANGNIGIGTSNPQSKFHIQSDANTSGSPGNSQVLISGVTNPEKRFSLAYNTSSNYAEMQSQAYSGAYTPIVINPNGGNVGIGTITPDSKLAVNGNIRAKEVKVETANWPDYVFTKDYQLPTLQQTENHIKDKGHLPGIPSAAEVKANGIDLGEMNAKLLQKIEELTLYLIEQNKAIQLQCKKSDRQQLKLDEQQLLLADQQWQIENLKKSRYEKN